MAESKTYKQRFLEYLWILILAVILIIFGFIMSGFKETFYGFVELNTHTDGLITDYFVQGSIGGAFLNAGILEIVAIGLLIWTGKEIDGITIASLFFFMGFALFGKNCVNVWPILFGVFLYSLIHKKAFKDLLPTAFFGCTMAPAVSEVLYYEALNPVLAIFCAVLLGVFLGLILPTVSKVAFSFHNGFNLYNVGFSGGIILTIVVSVLKVFGFTVHVKNLWYTGDATPFFWFLLIFFVYIFFYGMLSGITQEKTTTIDQMKRIVAEDGILPTDFYKKEGKSATLANMGLVGILSVTFVGISGAPFNGPTIGAIMSIAGFAAAGKHVRNVIYIYIGALLGAMFKMWDLTEPNIIIGALFATGLAPIGGAYGPVFGILAAMIHISVVQNTTDLHFGLNLYNNGFACGMVALFINGVVKFLKFPYKGDPFIRHMPEYQARIKNLKGEYQNESQIK